MTPQTLQSILPFVVIGAVMLLRWRRVGKAVPFRMNRMWISPVIVSVLIGVMLFALPPAPLGWASFAGGLFVGLLVGWYRGKLMHLELDPATGALMMRQSPAAFLFLLVLFGARRLLAPTPQAAGAVGTPHALPLITDALFGFALGTVIGMRVELYLRAKKLHAA